MCQGEKLVEFHEFDFKIGVKNAQFKKLGKKRSNLKNWAKNSPILIKLNENWAKNERKFGDI